MAALVHRFRYIKNDAMYSTPASTDLVESEVNATHSFS